MTQTKDGERREEAMYRIILTDKGMDVACIQWFDEPDYDMSKVLLKPFNTELEAREFISEVKDVASSAYFYEEWLTSDQAMDALIFNVCKKLGK